MHPCARHLRRTTLLPLVGAVSAWALLTGLATAQGAPPSTPPALTIKPRPSPAAAVDTVLRHLPANQNQLTLRGEAASRSFKIVLGRTEAARISVFQMALVNAVSLLPERSTVKVAINGTVVAAVPAGSSDKPTVTAIKIPAGLLLPGANSVRVSTVLTHRVDCSVPATYELWAMLDPAQTGFVVPRDAASVVHTADDLAVEPLAEDGTTHIHLRMPDDADTAAIGEAGLAIATLARRAGLTRPIVDVGPDLGTGPGFDVVVAKGQADAELARTLTGVSKADGMTIGRVGTSDRLVVVLPGGDAPDGMVAKGTTSGEDTGSDGVVLRGFRKTFAELGLPSQAFAGRHYLSSLDVNLPPDFLAANDRARLLIDGTHSAALVEGDGLVFRVNGTLVSSLPFAAGKAERFQHAVVELPLRFFHPGHNDLSIEGTTAAVADAQCDTVSMSREPRLTLANTSEFDFPSFAHLAMMPELPTAMASDGGPISLYLASNSRAAIGTGLTVVANIAVTHDRTGALDVRIGTPGNSDAPGIVVAPAEQLPDAVATAIRKLSKTVVEQPDSIPDQEGTALTQTADDTPATTTPLSAAASANAASLVAQATTVTTAIQSILRSRGFFFASDGAAELLPVTNTALVIAAVAPQSETLTIGGVAMPHFNREPAQWLAVTAADMPTIENGVRRLIADGRWSALGGQAVSFDTKDGALASVQPRTVDYVVPNSLVVADLRPIVGGIMSDNIIMSIGVLLILMSILGLSTHVLIRRIGAR